MLFLVIWSTPCGRLLLLYLQYSILAILIQEFDTKSFNHQLAGRYSSLLNRRIGKTILLTCEHLFPHNKHRGGEQRFGKEKASDFSR